MKKVDPNVSDLFLWGEWYDIFWFHSCYVPGCAYTIQEETGYGLTTMIVEQEGNVERIYISRNEWSEIGQKYFNDILKNPNKLANSLKKIRDAAEKLTQFSISKLSADDPAVLPVVKIIEVLDKYHTYHHAVWSFGMVPNVLDLQNTVMRDYLEAWLKDHGVNQTDLPSVFQALVTPEELSSAQKEERDMLTLAMKANAEDAITNHWKKYHWLQFGWTGPILTREYFEEVHRGLVVEGKAQERLEKVQTEDAQRNEAKQVWIKKLQMPEDIQRLFRLYEKILAVKTCRMDALYLSYACIQPFLKRIAKEYFLSLDQIYALYLPWFFQMIKENNVDAHKINEIAKYSVQYFNGGTIKLYVGDEARKIIAPLKASLPPPPEVKELKGECAYPGVVKGRVCIVNRAAEMIKFEAGSILVSNATDPSLLPIMKQAIAFITNMGGLTCHAAIVARELRTPCIVGTKVASYVLKDGDEVEIDAAKGIVKKI